MKRIERVLSALEKAVTNNPVVQVELEGPKHISKTHKQNRVASFVLNAYRDVKDARAEIETIHFVDDRAAAEFDTQEITELAARQIEDGRVAARLIMMEFNEGIISPEQAAASLRNYQSPTER